MTPDTPLTPAEETEALAAEQALGLLEGDEAREARARMDADPAFARAVCDWQERLAAMAEDLTPVMAPARARQAIRERLGHAIPPLSNDPVAPRPWWRGPIGALAGLAAAAAVAVAIWLPGTGTTPAQPGYQARLESPEAALTVTARVTDRQLEVALQGQPAPQGRDWEIWWIADADATPLSLGVVPRDGSARIDLPQGLEPGPQVQLALSDEPTGGSPTGQATGPVLAIAALTSM